MHICTYIGTCKNNFSRTYFFQVTKCYIPISCKFIKICLISAPPGQRHTIIDSSGLL